MEVVLESVAGVPEGGLLSIKIGDTKRQAPVARLGQPFRFASSLAEPLPLTAELLVPAAPPRVLRTDPAAERLTVDFGGGMQVVLRQREARELQRPPVDLGGSAQARGLPVDKLQDAQKAASYLEEHDLVRTFQEILHGLLVTKPGDPLAYVEDRLARAKTLAARTAGAGKPPEEGAVPPPPKSAGSTRPNTRGSVRKSMMESRGMSTTFSKVDTLLLTLQCAHENLPLVLPFLPTDLRQMLESNGLAEECQSRFKALDVHRKGQLSPEDLIPVIEQLSSAKSRSVGRDECRRFVAMFDTDEDGVINLEEFGCLVQFVLVAGYLESTEGKKVIEVARLEENNFRDFLDMIQEDKERLWSIVPFLPQWLVDHLTSRDFQESCSASFRALDADQSGSLDPTELIVVIQSLSEAHPLTIDHEKCRKFTDLFDTNGNGVIMRDEFIEFAQFLTVMNFLANSSDGKHVQECAGIAEASVRAQELITMLEGDRNLVAEVLPEMPRALVSMLTADAFKEACSRAFGAVDKSGAGSVDLRELFPMICDLGAPHAIEVSQAECTRFAASFRGARAGAVAKDEFPELARFVILMGYLHYTKEHQDLLVADVLLGQDRIAELLKVLAEGVEKIGELIPFLPQSLVDDLTAEAFSAQCTRDFQELDKDASGNLEPKELFPVILQLAEAHKLSLSDEHCARFVDIFDSEQNGVISEGEFVNFVRFMMIMAFMETEEGRRVSLDMVIVKGQEDVEELLRMLEQDRSAVRKVVPLLPKEVYDELISDSFVTACHERFAELNEDKTGVLRPHELFPVVVELSEAHPYAVSEEQCARFAAIFDLNGDGLLRPDEFLDFTRFLCIMSYLHTPQGREAAKDALLIMAESKNIEELLETMARDRRDICKVLPHLPHWLKADLLGPQFTLECLRFFRDLDKDGSGTLDPEELFPMVLALSEAHKQSLDIDQCRRFAAIFDDAKGGVITKDEFVEFSRFLIVMGYLRSQEGQEILGAALSSRRPTPELTLPEPGAAGAEEDAPPGSPAHLAVDCEFYLRRSEKLASENESLRERLLGLEGLVRKMEDKLEDQGQRLRHAEVDLRLARSPR